MPGFRPPARTMAPRAGASTPRSDKRSSAAMPPFSRPHSLQWRHWDGHGSPARTVSDGSRFISRLAPVQAISDLRSARCGRSQKPPLTSSARSTVWHGATPETGGAPWTTWTLWPVAWTGPRTREGRSREDCILVVGLQPLHNPAGQSEGAPLRHRPGPGRMRQASTRGPFETISGSNARERESMWKYTIPVIHIVT